MWQYCGFAFDTVQLSTNDQQVCTLCDVLKYNKAKFKTL